MTAFPAPFHTSSQFRGRTDPRRTPLSHVVNDVPCEPRASSLIDALEQGAASGGLCLDLLDGRNRPHELTYADLLAGARRWAAHFAERGLTRGAPVVLLLPTSADFVFAFYGIQIAGGVPVPCAPPFTFGGLEKYVRNLKHVVRDCGAEMFVTNARFKKAIGSVLADADNRVRHLVLDSDVPEARVPDSLRFPPLQPTDVAFLQYTSGTTGRPKGVVLTHGNLLANVHGIGVGLGIGPDDVGMSWLPLFHDMGLIGVLFTCLYWQIPVHVMAPEHFILHPHRWLENITRFRVTLSPAPNFAYHLCMRRVTEEQFAQLDLSSWRIALNGAEPVDHETVARFQERFAAVGFGARVLFPVYGMAENSLAATFPDIENPYVVREIDREILEQQGRAVPARRRTDPAGGPAPFKAVSVGYPLSGQEIAVVDGRGAVVPENRVGEILVRGPSVTLGYHHNAEETDRAIRDGWLHTGDLGFVSERRLFVTGRKKELIIRMGRNYYPYDIERTAAEVDGVRKGCLAAFASPNAETGSEDIVLVAETRETDEAARERMKKEINAALLASLGVRADRIVLAPPRTIPKTTSGKIQRSACRQRYVSQRLEAGGPTERIRAVFAPFKSLIASFLGLQRFRLRRRTRRAG